MKLFHREQQDISMMARLSFIILIICAAFSLASSARELPEFIKVCKRDDPELDNCIVGSVDHLKPYLVKGVPEYHLPSLEPLLLKELVFSETAGIKITATDINAYGASNFIVKRVVTDFKNLRFNVDIELPHLYMEGNYMVDGRVLLLLVTGSGAMHGNFTDCIGKVVFNAELINESDGAQRFHVTDMNLKITVGKGNLHLENLFNGEKVLGDVVNSALNANFDTFARELMPLIEKALASLFLEIGNNIVGPFTYQQLFPE